MIRRWLDGSANPLWRGWEVCPWLLLAAGVGLPIFIAAWRPLRTCGG